MSVRKRINDRYELEPTHVVKGGMGEVWLARDVKLERKVAVKFLRFPDGTEDKELVQRFVRESRITARLEHPGVPAVYDVGTYEGRPYIVMQHIDGVSVADLIAEEGPLPIGWAAAIAAQTCSVLSVAHQASLVHRDLKPANLLLEPHGGIKVLDFGLAVALDRAEYSRITRTGHTLGTPAYMAPEQVLAAMSGPASDLYALGCTLHEMLTGKPVFTGSTAFAVMSKQVDERPPPVRSIRPEVPEHLERLILALLEKKPEDRPESADVVYEMLLPYATMFAPLFAARAPLPRPNPVRRYAAVLHRIDEDASSASHPPSALTLPSTPSEPPEISRSELDRARQEASSLVKQSRYSQAVDVLTAVLEPATRAFGSSDDDVVTLRMERANAPYNGGDYRKAAPEYRELATRLAARHGPDSEIVLRCRLQEATCHALIGQTSLALRQLHELLDIQRSVYGEDDDRTLELRRQIGLLQLGAGQRDAAHETLSRLRADVVRVNGPDHPRVREITDLLSGLRRGQH